jgi:cytochrome c
VNQSAITSLGLKIPESLFDAKKWIMNMDSFEWNKVFGGLLGVALFVMAINMVSEGIFHSSKPAIAGYELPTVEVAQATGGAQQPAAPSIPLPELLAKADAKKGESAAKKCVACHSFDKGGPNKVGPNMWDVVNRVKGQVAGFGYSAALKERNGKGEKWGYDQLNGFLENPKKYTPGTTMAFAGVSKPEERADIISYLRGLSDAPAPLP